MGISSSYARNTIWSNDILLWEDTVRKSPASFIAIGNLVTSYNIKGINCFSQNMLNEAIQHLHAALALQPGSAETYNNLGLAYEKKGQLDTAIRMFSSAIALNPNFTFAYTNRGNAYNEQGQIRKALADYDTVIGLSKNYADVYLERGLMYRRLGKLSKARSDFQQACTMGSAKACEEEQKGHAISHAFS